MVIRSYVLGCLLLVWATTLSPARADFFSFLLSSSADKPPRSHVPLEPADEKKSAEEMYQSHITELNKNRDIKKLLPGINDTAISLAKRFAKDEKLMGALRKFLEDNPGILDDPEIQENFKQRLKDHKDLQLPANIKPEDFKQLVTKVEKIAPDILKNLPTTFKQEQPSSQSDHSPTESSKAPPTNETVKPINPERPKDSTGSKPATTDISGSNKPGETPDDSASSPSDIPGVGVGGVRADYSEEFAIDGEIADWLKDYAENLQGWAAPLRNSPALRQVIRELSQKSKSEDDTFWGKNVKEWKEGIFEASRNSSLNRVLNENGLSQLRNLTLSPLSRGDLPDMGLSWKLGGAFKMPTLEGAAGHSSQTRTGLMWITVIVLVALLLWRLFHNSNSSSSQANRAWNLGPWPVKPHKISTRDELIRAFEYLSLLQLGKNARSWHHLDIATGLGGDVDERCQAASKLAGLYERARYAPPSERFPEEWFQNARRELCFLAGVPLS